MADKIIGIEVAGLTYGIEDADTANIASQAKTQAVEATTKAEEASSAVTEQSEKVAEIESNIGNVNISELSGTVEGHTEELNEISEELPKIKTDISDAIFKGANTPLFTLENIQAKGVALSPTISIPASVTGGGVFVPTNDRLAGYTFSLYFFSDCIAVTKISALRRGAIPTEWSYFGYVTFGILYDYIKTLLRTKYADRLEEVENYINNVMPTFTKGGEYPDKQNIVFQGEPGAECIVTQALLPGSSGSAYFSFSYECRFVIKVLSAGSYSDSSIVYMTFMPVRIKGN